MKVLVVGASGGSGRAGTVAGAGRGRGHEVTAPGPARASGALGGPARRAAGRRRRH